MQLSQVHHHQHRSLSDFGAPIKPQAATQPLEAAGGGKPYPPSAEDGVATAPAIAHFDDGSWGVWLEEWIMLRGRPRPMQLQRVADGVTRCDEVRRALGSIEALPVNFAVHVLRQGRTPRYAEGLNPIGGHFTFRLALQSLTVERAVEAWWQLLQDAVEDGLPHPCHVVGASVLRKPAAFTLKLWVANSEAEAAVRAIRTSLITMLAVRNARFSPHRCILRNVSLVPPVSSLLGAAGDPPCEVHDSDDDDDESASNAGSEAVATSVVHKHTPPHRRHHHHHNQQPQQTKHTNLQPQQLLQPQKKTINSSTPIHSTYKPVPRVPQNTAGGGQNAPRCGDPHTSPPHSAAAVPTADTGIYTYTPYVPNAHAHNTKTKITASPSNTADSVCAFFFYGATPFTRHHGGQEPAAI